MLCSDNIDCGNDLKSTCNHLVASLALSSYLRFQHSMCIWYLAPFKWVDLVSLILSPEPQSQSNQTFVYLHIFRTIKSTVKFTNVYLFRCFSVPLSLVCSMWSFNFDSISNRSEMCPAQLPFDCLLMFINAFAFFLNMISPFFHFMCPHSNSVFRNELLMVWIICAF